MPTAGPDQPLQWATTVLFFRRALVIMNARCNCCVPFSLIFANERQRDRDSERKRGREGRRQGRGERKRERAGKKEWREARGRNITIN